MLGLGGRRRHRLGAYEPDQCVVNLLYAIQSTATGGELGAQERNGKGPVAHGRGEELEAVSGAFRKRELLEEVGVVGGRDVRPKDVGLAGVHEKSVARPLGADEAHCGSNAMVF